MAAAIDPGPVQLLERVKGGAERATRAPSTITAAALVGKHFPEPRWAVEPLIAEGVTILAGAPKLGKSWAALNIAVAIALGGRAMGKLPVTAGDVLYLALEDTERRLQSRLLMVLEDAPAPDRLTIATEWPTMMEGGDAYLRAWLADHRDARLVIIDTVARNRGVVLGNQNNYSADYEAFVRYKSIADEFSVAFLLVHHTRKAGAEDPLDMVSGTNGIAGAVDTVLILKREIGRADATLYVRGRDVAETEHAMAFEPSSCLWTILGDARDYRISAERQAIVDLLVGAPEPMRPKDIAEALNKKPGTVRKMLHEMSQAGTIVALGGTYRLPLVTGPAVQLEGWEGI